MTGLAAEKQRESATVPRSTFSVAIGTWLRPRDSELLIWGQEFESLKHRKIARSSLCLEFAPDGPDVLGSQRRLGSCKFSFVPWQLFWRQNKKYILIFHGHAPLLVDLAIMRVGVRFREPRRVSSWGEVGGATSQFELIALTVSAFGGKRTGSATPRPCR